MSMDGLGIIFKQPLHIEKKKKQTNKTKSSELGTYMDIVPRMPVR